MSDRDWKAYALTLEAALREVEGCKIKPCPQCRELIRAALSEEKPQPAPVIPSAEDLKQAGIEAAAIARDLQERAKRMRCPPHDVKWNGGKASCIDCGAKAQEAVQEYLPSAEVLQAANRNQLEMIRDLDAQRDAANAQAKECAFNYWKALDETKLANDRTEKAEARVLEIASLSDRFETERNRAVALLRAWLGGFKDSTGYPVTQTNAFLEGFK